MRTFDTPYDTAFWRSQPRITSNLYLIKNNLSSTTPTTSLVYAKIFEYELGNENGYITTELTSEIKSFLLNANGARFCVFHGTQKYGEIDSTAWYTPAYFINNTDIFDNRTKVKFYGSPLPQIADWSSPISVSATDPFTTVFDNLLAGAGNTYKPDGFSKETRSYQYWHTYDMETSGNISMYDMNDLVSLLKRKYLVQAFARSYDGANHKVLFQNRKLSLTSVGFDYIGKLQLISDTSNRNIRLFYTDETGIVTDTGYGTKSHNLGFIPSTANASELNAMTGIQKPIFRITECFDPRHENGDLLEITTPAIQDSPYYTWGAYITVTERFKNGEYLETIIETPTFPDGIGASGTVKSNSKNAGIASVLDTSQFGIILNTTDNTLQKALDTLDDHDHSGLATTEGIQDIVGAMFSSNTETGITVTYDDSDGTIDFVAEVTQAELDAHFNDTSDVHAYTSLSGRPIAETNTNWIYGASSPGGTSAFVGTINGTPSGTSVVYNVSSGTEGSMKPSATTHLAKMRLYNTTRGTSALISDVNTGTNTITLTATVPAAWANGDTITIASQTVTGAPISYCDFEITSGPTNKLYLFVNMIIISTTVGDNMRYHPLETYGNGKQKTAVATVASQNGVNYGLLKITSNVFSMGWTGTPSNIILTEDGYLE